MTLLFSSALFLSACLLFWLELIFAKQILPLLGGSPSVWNTCTLFYQTTLLAGYVYARFVSTRLSPRRQAVLHACLWLAAALALPASLPSGWQPAPLADPVWTLLRLALVSIALPMFALSTAGPLLQSWFSLSRHRDSKDPYFLYQASNLGSLAALVSYPTLVEPYLKLRTQTIGWSMVFAAAAAATFAGAALISTARAKPEKAAASSAAAWPLRLRWAALAFVPSSLMLGATTYLSSQIAPIPLLWVVTLGIYLASFVVTFARKPLISRQWTMLVQPYFLVPTVLLLATNTHDPTWLLVFFHLSALAVCALACHGELAARRPPVQQLTDFYLWLAIGGAAGGLFNALIAPAIFRTVAEYPLALVLAAFVHARLRRDDWNWGDLAYPLIVGLATAALPSILRGAGLYEGPWLLFLPLAACLLFFIKRPARLGFGMSMLLLASLAYQVEPGRLLRIRRSFFGVYRVVEYPGTSFHLLSSGSIVHGGQNMDPRYRQEPLAYYTRLGPLGQLFESLGVQREKNPIAVIGLGTGGTACFGRAGQSWIFYEIDPLVRRIAEDDRYFTFLRDCPPRSDIILGDARLSLRQAPDRFYSWIVVDAFNSDAIPVHLLTSEALDLYQSKLAPHGRIVFHISSHYLDLEPVLSALAKAHGLHALIGIDDNSTPAPPPIFKSASQWVVLAADAADLAPLDKDPRWRPLRETSRPEWTDEYSNLLGAIRWD